MKNDGWVRWSQWSEAGMIGFGQMPLRNVDKNLREFAETARTIMDKTHADHVVYGLKTYDDDGILEEVKFYLMPMNDYDFQNDVATLTGCTVYALHNGTVGASRQEGEYDERNY